MTDLHPPLPTTPYVTLSSPDLTRWAAAATRGDLKAVSVAGVAINRDLPDDPRPFPVRAEEAVTEALLALGLHTYAAAVSEPVLLRAPGSQAARFIEMAATVGMPVAGWPDGLEAARAVARHPESLAFSWTVTVDTRLYAAALS